MGKIAPSDVDFVRTTLLPKFGVKRVYLKWSDSKKVWPDIWVELGKVPIITVTQEWAKQSLHERRKRLVHEFLHISGFEHNESLGYSTHPGNDYYSKRVYKSLVNPTHLGKELHKTSYVSRRDYKRIYYDWEKQYESLPDNSEVKDKAKASLALLRRIEDVGQSAIRLKYEDSKGVYGILVASPKPKFGVVQLDVIMSSPDIIASRKIASVGTSLIRELVLYALKNKFEKISLQPSSSAVGFYEKLGFGFNNIRTSAYMYRDGMEKFMLLHGPKNPTHLMGDYYSKKIYKEIIGIKNPTYKMKCTGCGYEYSYVGKPYLVEICPVCGISAQFTKFSGEK